MYHVAKNTIQCNKEAVTISRDFVLISCLLINPQVLSLNLLNLQCNTNVVTIRRDLILISCLLITHQVLSVAFVRMDSVFIVFLIFLGIQFYVVLFMEL